VPLRLDRAKHLGFDTHVGAGSTRGAVLVTGGTRRAGIAAAVALRLARDGWKVAVTGWRPYDAEELRGSRDEDARGLVAELRELGAEAAFHEDDLGDPAAPARVLDFAERAIGPVDALVLAHAHSRAGGLLETSVEEWDRHMDVNARGAFLLCAEFARRWRGEPGSGRIVACTSAPPLVGEVAYAGSKGAVEWLALTAAAELAPGGITVNAVDPGPTDTGWLEADSGLAELLLSESPLGRLGRPEDAAELVAFLLSPAGGWITGQVLHSDGGFGSIRTLRRSRDLP
jgi:3-oxoacyl-[acyl-carrier protein] reductase